MDIIFSFENPVIQLLLSSFLGAFLGIRREIDTKRFSVKNEFMGLRSLSLIAFFGTFSTFFPSFPSLPIIFFCILSLFMIIAYYHGRFKLGIYGMTTEISSLAVFWIGVLVGMGESGVLSAVIISIFLATINAYKYSLHGFVKTLTKKEWSGALQLGMISVIVLPLLPKFPVDPLGVFIPFQVWFLVVLISGIGFVGYFLVKYLGFKGGIPLIGFLGALTSSLAVIIAMSQQSKKFEYPNIFSGGTMIAIGTMQLKVVSVVFLLAGAEIHSFLIIPLMMALMSYAMGFYFSFFRSKKDHSEEFNPDIMKLQSPFEIKPALKFGFIFTFILFVLALGQRYIGDAGVYFASFVSGLFDIDAIVLSSLEAFKQGELPSLVTKNAIMLAIFVNTITKIGFVYMMGSRSLFYRASIGILISGFVGIIGFILYWN